MPLTFLSNFDDRASDGGSLHWHHHSTSEVGKTKLNETQALYEAFVIIV